MNTCFLKASWWNQNNRVLVEEQADSPTLADYQTSEGYPEPRVESCKILQTFASFDLT